MTSTVSTRPSAAKRYCFTLNNYSDEEYITIINNINAEKPVCAIVGKEVSAFGTPHLQGFIHLTRRVRLNTLKIILGMRIHAEVARGTDAANIEYCHKQDRNPFIYGTVSDPDDVCGFPFHKKIRCILSKLDTPTFHNEILHDDRLLGTYAVFKDRISSIHNDIIANNNRFIIQHHMQTFKLRIFQKVIFNIVQEIPDARKVHWYFDANGNTGKTWVSTMLVAHFHAIRFENGKSADIKFSYNGEKIVIFDLSRSQSEHINYEIIESIKNGILFSTKYKSHMKVFPVPHVLIFANVMPDFSKLSMDRWDITSIDNSNIEFLPEEYTIAPSVPFIDLKQLNTETSQSIANSDYDIHEEHYSRFASPESSAGVYSPNPSPSSVNDLQYSYVAERF